MEGRLVRNLDVPGFEGLSQGGEGVAGAAKCLNPGIPQRSRQGANRQPRRSIEKQQGAAVEDQAHRRNFNAPVVPPHLGLSASNQGVGQPMLHSVADLSPKGRGAATAIVAYAINDAGMVRARVNEAGRAGRVVTSMGSVS